jgi:hypothetical protein
MAQRLLFHLKLTGLPRGQRTQSLKRHGDASIPVDDSERGLDVVQKLSSREFVELDVVEIAVPQTCVWRCGAGFDRRRLSEKMRE